MAENLELKIIAREMVKPSPPTPAHLSRFNLSLVDQMAVDILVPSIFFYSGNGNMNLPGKCRGLKSSLSKTLSLFYPLAGRIRDNFWIDCCDDGVEFVEAELNCPMSHFLGSPHPDLHKPLVPLDWNRKADDQTFLCLIQATLFDCGGLAICICLSHKIFDGATCVRFIQAWATIARESDHSRHVAVESPDLGRLASLFPPIPLTEASGFNNDNNGNNISCGQLLTRKLFFSASKMEKLKARASSNVVDQPTRVEAVMGLIWKSAVAASTSVKGSSGQKHSAAAMAINLRKMLAPLVSKNTVGNIVGSVFATSETSDMTISNQVIALRKANEVFKKRVEGIAAQGSSVKAILPMFLFQEGHGEFMSRVDKDFLYFFTSFCGYPVYFDFGWGRPRLVIPYTFFKNSVLLTDTEDLRGVLAFVTMEEQEMNFFEKDQHLLSFASLSSPGSINYSGKFGPKPKL